MSAHPHGPVLHDFPDGLGADRECRAHDRCVPALVDLWRHQRTGNAGGYRCIGEMDDVVDMGVVVDAEAVAGGVEQQRDRDGRVEAPREPSPPRTEDYHRDHERDHGRARGHRVVVRKG